MCKGVYEFRIWGIQDFWPEGLSHLGCGSGERFRGCSYIWFRVVVFAGLIGSVQ